MQSFVNVFEMPAVQSIIENAEQKIKTLAGVDVRLNGKVVVNVESPATKLLKTFISSRFHVSWVLISGKSKSCEVKWARRYYSWINIKILKRSSVTTASDLNKDHSTVLTHISILSESKTGNIDRWNDLNKCIAEFENKLKLLKYERY